MNQKSSRKSKKSFFKWRNAKKRLRKKFYNSLKKSESKNSFSLFKSPRQPYDSNMTSDWYWSNYKKAQNYWRTTPLTDNWQALLEDHPEVEDLIKQYLPYTYSLVRGTEYFNSRFNNFQKNNVNLESETKNLSSTHSSVTHNSDSDTNSCSDDSEEIKFEMSEEMIEFFKVSFRHKLNLQKEKEEQKQKIDVENQVLEIQSNRLKRTKEMKLLYGEDASKIIGMETALQLSFDKYCDTKSPKYWPNIPLKL